MMQYMKLWRLVYCIFLFQKLWMVTNLSGFGFLVFYTTNSRLTVTLVLWYNIWYNRRVTDCLVPTIRVRCIFVMVYNFGWAGNCNLLNIKVFNVFPAKKQITNLPGLGFLVYCFLRSSICFSDFLSFLTPPILFVSWSACLFRVER